MNRINDEDDIEEDEEFIYNESQFDNLQSTFKNLVLLTKRQLYDCIIKAPAITSKEAQDNRLLIEYITKLNILYQMCNALHTGDVTMKKIESKLFKFPIDTHATIKELMIWLSTFENKNRYVDTIPYNDYLEIQLIRHPFLQK